MHSLVSVYGSNVASIFLSQSCWISMVYTVQQLCCIQQPPSASNVVKDCVRPSPAHLFQDWWYLRKYSSHEQFFPLAPNFIQLSANQIATYQKCYATSLQHVVIIATSLPVSLHTRRIAVVLALCLSCNYNKLSHPGCCHVAEACNCGCKGWAKLSYQSRSNWCKFLTF